VLSIIIAISGFAATLGAPITAAEPQLHVGGLSLSAYEVNKTFSRYLEVEKKPRHEASLAAWLPGYMNEVIALADAKEKGYLNAPATVDGVYRMERNMLANPGLLLSDYLANAQGAWHEEKESHEIIVLSRLLIPASKAKAEPPTSFNAALSGIVSNYERGLLLQDFACSPELRHKLSEADLGALITESQPNGDLVCWRKDALFQAPAGSVVAAAFANKDKLERRLFQKHWTDFIEKEVAQTKVDEKALGAIQAELLAAINQPPATKPSWFNQAVGSYRQGDRQTTIAAGQLIDYQQRQFSKSPQRSLDDLQALTKNLMLEEITYCTSLSLGLHRTEKFQADKRGYLHALALEDYQRREIEPTLDLSLPRLKTWYEQHASRFSSPAWYRVDAYVFSSEKEVSEALHNLRLGTPAGEGGASGRPTVQGAKKELKDLRLTSSDPRLDQNTAKMLRMLPPGRPLPSAHFEGEPAVLIKHEQGGSLVEPYEKVEDHVRRGMIKESRPAALAKHVQSLRPRFPLRADDTLIVDPIGPLRPVLEQVLATLSDSSPHPLGVGTSADIKKQP